VANVQNVNAVVEGLRQGGIDFVASVPDQHLVELVERISTDDAFVHVPLCREEEGVGVCTGAYFGGRRPMLLMQNAGLLNSVNALTTTALQFEIPMLLLAWYAGDFGDTAFMRLGEVTEPVLRGLGIRYIVLRDPAGIVADVVRAARLALYSKRPVALLATYAALEE
jgi:sulfopyruvate decarboxylase subunit alpha